MLIAPKDYKTFPRAKVIEDVDGWPVGSVGYHEERPRLTPTPTVPGVIWNEDGTEYWHHTINDNATYTDEEVNI